MENLLKSNKGFTLIELIISLAIFGMIITPISSLFISSYKANISAKNQMRATYIAQREMERLKTSYDITNRDGENIVDNTYTDFNYDIEINQVNKYEYGEEYDELMEDINFISYSGFSAGKEYDFIIDNNGYVNINYKNSIIYTDKIDIVLEDYIKILLETNKDISIKIYNNSNKEVRFYTYNDNSVSVYNRAGKTKIFSNLDKKVNDDSLEYNSRVYEIKVKVYKDGEKLEELEGYKNITN